ncbi:MAG: hypothetical protein WBD71_07195 [Xanthobacteraceae bacterium]
MALPEGAFGALIVPRLMIAPLIVLLEIAMPVLVGANAPPVMTPLEPLIMLPLKDVLLALIQV